MADLTIRAAAALDRAYLKNQLIRHFAATRVVSRGRLHECLELPGFIAEIHGQAAGLCQYDVQGGAMEIVTLISSRYGYGVGPRLLDHAVQHARHNGVTRLWLITTNDNLKAIRFYQRHGWQQVAVHKGAVAEARKLKPEIPLQNNQGCAIDDELEFEYPLAV